MEPPGVRGRRRAAWALALALLLLPLLSAGQGSNAAQSHGLRELKPRQAGTARSKRERVPPDRSGPRVPQAAGATCSELADVELPSRVLGARPASRVAASSPGQAPNGGSWPICWGSANRVHQGHLEVHALACACAYIINMLWPSVKESRCR